MNYPLLPYSQLVFDMTRWFPRVYLFPVTFRWRDGANQKARVENAFRAALANHPVFSTRVDWNGQQYAIENKDILHGQFYDVDIFTKGSDLYLNISGSRILGDGASGVILVEDISRAYNGEQLERDDYWGYMSRYMQQQTEPHYNQSKAKLESEFADETVPVRPTTDRRRLMTLLPPKPGIYADDYTALHEKIERLSKEHFISYEGIFSLCAALAIAEYCGTDKAALTWAYEGRETPEEQRIFGSLHRDIPFQIKAKGQKEELIKEARNQIRSGIAHSDYPYTLTKPYCKRWNYAVNVLRVEDAEDMLRKTSLPIEVVSIPEQKYAYALLDIEIHKKTDSLTVLYRYSATHYKEESIRRFAALVRKYVEWLLES